MSGRIDLLTQDTVQEIKPVAIGTKQYDTGVKKSNMTCSAIVDGWNHPWVITSACVTGFCQPHILAQVLLHLHPQDLHIDQVSRNTPIHTK